MKIIKCIVLNSVLILGAPAPLLAGELPGAFEANFDVLRNGKVIAEATFKLTTEGDSYVMTSDTEGTKGMARMLGVEEASVSRGHWLNGGPKPDAFEQLVKVAIKKITTSAEFDWDGNQVISEHDGEVFTLPLSGQEVDSVSIGLAIRSGLAEGVSDWKLLMLDEDEFEEQVFRAEEATRIDTALGCLHTVEVKKIRHPESKRYTNTWYATDHDFVPVRVEHGKQDGDHMETRIKSLTLEGNKVEIVPDC